MYVQNSAKSNHMNMYDTHIFKHICQASRTLNPDIQHVTKLLEGAFLCAEQQGRNYFYYLLSYLLFSHWHMSFTMLIFSQLHVSNCNGYQYISEKPLGDMGNTGVSKVKQ